MRFLLALASALALAASAPQPAESRSLLQSIPGAGLLSNMTFMALDMLNDLTKDTARQMAVNPLTSHLYDYPAELVADGAADQAPESGAPKDPDTKRNVSEIIRSRQFEAEEYDVITADGYVLTIQRIVNPLVDSNYRARMKPVIMQHGLMSSSVDWVINSLSVRPEKFPQRPRGGSSGARFVDSLGADEPPAQGQDQDQAGQVDVGDTQQHPNSLGFYLANRGYDVFLANSRGNIYGQRHVNMSSWEPKFWDFTFDEQIKYDLPAVIEFVQQLTNHTKLGYVGHSQGTVMMFGLLSERPEYADVIEPFVALAPVAYCNNAITPAKYFAVYTPIFQHVDMWFATSNAAVKYLGPLVCGPRVVRKDICSNLVFLGVGFNEEELDDSRLTAYLNHMPSGTSVKNIAHYGQEIISGRFAKFDHGILGNQVKYGRARAPDYDLTKIRSSSIALFTAENDWLASPKDVARLKAELRVPPFAVYNISELMPKWNHIDFVYGKHAGEVVNTRVFEVFEHFNKDTAAS